MFKKGKSGNPKGKSNPGLAGRKPDWFKLRAEMFLKKKDSKTQCDYLEFLYKVLHGYDFEQGINENGEVLKIPPSIKDRLAAGRDLADRAKGKPAQAIINADDDGKNIPYSIVIETVTGDNGKPNV